MKYKRLVFFILEHIINGDVMNYQTAISFGLVHIPVLMNNAIKNNDVSFNLLHKKCKERLEYIRYCPHCKTKVKNDEIEKGYEYKKDDYVTFTDNDFAKLKSENDKIIEIISFVDINEIDPIYYEKSYTLTPNNSSKAFNLFKWALRKSKKVAIAKTILRNKLYYVVIRFGYENIIMDTLYYEEEIKLQREKMVKDFSDNELNMALKLIKAMSAKFTPEEYIDEYQNNLKMAIDKKIKRKDIKKIKSKKKRNINDLMTALEESLKEQNERK